MSDENPNPDGESAGAKPEKAKGGGGKAGVILTFLNLGATGFLVFRSLTAPPPAAPVTEAVAQAPAPPVEGPIAPMEPFVINLRDEGISRYLKTSFELELDTPQALTTLETSKRAIRDDILRYLSGLTVADTLGEEAKDKIQEGIVARLDKHIAPGRVRKLYFTDFVIQ